MAKVLMFHLDGKLPNIALIRIAAHHRTAGDEVEIRRTGQRVNSSCPAGIFVTRAFPAARSAWW